MVFFLFFVQNEIFEHFSFGIVPAPQDLQHPNEFIRGSTLRFLCKLKESELLEPLMPAIRACLEHRHSYVRRNAVLAIYTIYRYSLCIHVFLSTSLLFRYYHIKKKKLTNDGIHLLQEL